MSDQLSSGVTRYGYMSRGHRPETFPTSDSDSTQLILDSRIRPYELVSYTIEQDVSAQQRIITWTTLTNDTITHIIPMDLPGIPYTYHSVESPQKKNIVAFCAYDSEGVIEHTFILKIDDRKTEELHDPIYRFISDKECEDFQSRVRGRRLLKTFDTDSISLVQSHLFFPKTHKEYGRKESIKIWRRTDTAITFLATLDAVDHATYFQFYLSWFKREAELHGKKLVLKFNHQRDVDQQHEPPPSEQKSTFNCIPSLLKAKKHDTDPNARRPSLIGSSSRRMVILHSGALKTDDSVKSKNFDALEIDFTADGDAENFVAACLKSQTEQGPVLRKGPHFVSHSDWNVQDIDPQKKHRRRLAIEQWWQRFIENRNEIFPMITDNYKPVRVAILDTGIDISNPYIQKNWTSKKLYRDFLKDDDVASTLKADDEGYSWHYVQEVVKLIAADRRDQATDLAGHGTHLAGIVLQLTPDASLCVARVLKHNLNPYDTAKAVRRVALAILYTVEVWKAKVINLSIGFVQEELEKLPDAKQVMINALSYARSQHVVVLAAASNSANRENLAFPACQHDYVLSINSTNGNGVRSDFNPLNQKYGENLSVLGENISSTWLQEDYGNKEGVFRQGESVWKRAEGTSQATTIAACVAVLILQFGRQYSVGEKLEKFAGVRAVLRAMTGPRETGDGFWDIVPWIGVFNMAPEGIDSIKSRILDSLRVANV